MEINAKLLAAARGRVEKLRTLACGAEKPLVLIYSNPDPDALGAASALKSLLDGVTANHVSIVYTGDIGRVENEIMVKTLDIKASSLKDGQLAAAGLVAVVDSQPEFFANMDLPRVDIVIDHHPRKSRRRHPFSDIRPLALATSSLLTIYLVAADIEINRKLATALYYGIQTDSRNLQKTPSADDLAAIHFLERRIDRGLLRRIECSSYSLNSLNYFSVALAKLRYANHVVYSDLGTIPSADILAQVGDFLNRAREAEWAVVSGIVSDRLVVVFRSDGHKNNVGKLAEAAFAEYGSAGGHRTMARAEIPGERLPGGIMLTQNERIENFVLSRLAAANRKFNPISRRVSRAIGQATPAVAK